MEAYDKGVSLLAVREHTGKELREKLSRSFSSEDVEKAVALLEEKGYLSDSRYAEVFIRSRMRRCPEGRPLLLQRLQEKGVERETASCALLAYWEEGLYEEPLRAAYLSLERKKGPDRARAALLRKGFTESEVRIAAAKVDDEAD